MGAEMSFDCGMTRKANPITQKGLLGTQLEFTPLGVAGAKHLVASAPFDMKELRLRHSSLGDAGIAVLAAVLPGSSVEVLDLRGNDISPTGVKTLAAVLPKTNVTVLLLSGNSICDDGLQSLCQALPNISRLEVLDVSCNHISGTGIRHLAHCLAKCRSLKELCIAHNDLGQAGSSSVVRALQALGGSGSGSSSTASLAKVDIRNVGLAPPDSVQLENLVRSSRGRLRVLGLLPSSVIH
mmetsp:Transcript_97980/g.204389  ORF Transcript_97980/g.204389 Transcript_97980/m.204389 type:complete len:239 (+) Transcript_97980:236-952(+)|eukprot:CAMPEP_0206424150 /NCGR_PEP_ID=MMETSP0324_2-20121206/3069_1 /ASSEMBLY_ACC=CAM_ASM_000836 /TAXON_ID=2866 /ORGANISM="Crypthecodinium cohnii, Strain Seligo" /LENGTH=238 /DNA_ID=CAMNT_0053888775 /DNA_START=205 /DNA_END=924 /DNA_ORIENTATION=+